MGPAPQQPPFASRGRAGATSTRGGLAFNLHCKVRLIPSAQAPSAGDAAMLDLALAIGHHLLVFALFGVLCAELIAVRRGMEASTVARIAAVDLWYGILAGLIVIVGFSRAVFAAKG